MNIIFSVLLAASGDLPQNLQDSETPEPKTQGFVRVRGGAWISRGFDFEAVTAGGLQVSTHDEALGSAALDVGVSIRERALLFVSAEACTGGGLEARVAGIYLGIRERLKPPYPPAMPHEITAYAGALWGQIEARNSAFGTFDDAWGFGGGFEFTWFLSRNWAVSVIGEYRLMRFKYEEDVVSGDTELGGSGVWAGASLELRF